MSLEYLERIICMYVIVDTTQLKSVLNLHLICIRYGALLLMSSLNSSQIAPLESAVSAQIFRF